MTQLIERIEILAYLNNYIQVPVDVIIRNDDLYDMDLKGWTLAEFNDLETDVKEALRFLGYRTFAIENDSLSFSYFENLKNL